MKIRRVVVTALVLSVAVLALAGCNSTTSVTTPAALNSTPPAAPANLIGAFNEGQQQDYLIWTASTSPTVASYEVWQYADNPSFNTGRLVGTVATGSTYLTLPAPTQNDIQLYRVRAKTADNTLSSFSATIRVQRHGATQQLSADPGPGTDPTPVTN